MSMSDTVEVWTRWVKIDGVVYMEWKLAGDKEWKIKKTAMKEVPYIQITRYPEEEWNLKKLKLLANPTQS